MSSLLWLALAGALLLIELVAPGFGGFLMGAVAALVLASLAGLALAPGLQWALFVALTVVGTAAIWRWSQGRGAGRSLESSQAELAEVIEGFGGDGQLRPGDAGAGRVRWQGQSWAAQNLDPATPLPPGSLVTVLGREGTRLQVLPQPPAGGSTSPALLSRRTSG